MLTKEENAILTRVTGDAPMGGIMRRHWLPACLSEEVAEAWLAPQRRMERLVTDGTDCAS